MPEAILPRLTDEAAMTLIQQLLDGREWDSLTLSDIADVVRLTGRCVEDLDESSV
jgi:hypothetical protein